MNTKPTALPTLNKIIIASTALMMIRIGALSRLAHITPDDRIWLYPITIDVLIAVCAPWIAYQLWTARGVLPWALALVFHAVAFQDATVGLLFDIMLPMAGQAAGEGAMPLIVILLIGVIAIWQLSRKAVRDFSFDFA